jgi:hypothetical protein
MVEMVGAGVWLSVHFLYLAVSFPGGRLSVVGFFLFLYSSIFFGEFVVFLCGFCVLKVTDFSNLLQVVSAQSELGGGSGTSA